MVVSLQLSKTLIGVGLVLTTLQIHHYLTEYGEDAMLDAVVQLRKTGEQKFVEALAYVDQKAKEGKVANREGYHEML